MNFLRFSGLSAMSEYFPGSSHGPPMAIETFNFGFFSFKLTTFLYWPALCTKILFQPKFIVHYWMKFLCIFKIFFFITSATIFFCFKFSIPTLNWMCDIIQVSISVDDVGAQHWVNILNKKFTITRSGPCLPSVYLANDNFVVRVDICVRRS